MYYELSCRMFSCVMGYLAGSFHVLCVILLEVFMYYEIFWWIFFMYDELSCWMFSCVMSYLAAFNYVLWVILLVVCMFYDLPCCLIHVLWVFLLHVWCIMNYLAECLCMSYLATHFIYCELFFWMSSCMNYLVEFFI